MNNLPQGFTLDMYDFMIDLKPNGEVSQFGQNLVRSSSRAVPQAFTSLQNLIQDVVAEYKSNGYTVTTITVSVNVSTLTGYRRSSRNAKNSEKTREERS